MCDVTMVGLGAMGSALARAFILAGHSVTVWNRSPGKMTPLVAAGAQGVASLAEAVAASPLTVVCVDNYDTTRALFGDDDARAALEGRTVVQLSTGTPKEAREAADWFADKAAAYIDGAIMPYPDGIGRADARLLFAGREAPWTAARPVLDCLGGDLRYLGDNIAAAAVLDMTFLVHELCNYMAALHGANVCAAEGVSLEQFAAMFEAGAPAHRLAGVIARADYGDPGATLEVWLAALQRVRQQAADADINREIPDLIAGLFERAIAAGYGEEDVAAVFKILRAG